MKWLNKLLAKTGSEQTQAPPAGDAPAEVVPTTAAVSDHLDVAGAFDDLDAMDVLLHIEERVGIDIDDAAASELKTALLSGRLDLYRDILRSYSAVHESPAALAEIDSIVECLSRGDLPAMGGAPKGASGVKPPPPEPREASGTAAHAAAVGPSADGHVRDGRTAYWYSSTNLGAQLTQVVAAFPPRAATRSKFGGVVLDNIMPTFEPHVLLKSQPWIVNWFHFDSDWGPHLMVRADKVAQEFIACPIRCAFGFCTLPASGLFTVHVHVDCPKLHPYLSSPQVSFELVLGLDTKYARENISKLLEEEELRITFTAFTDGNASATQVLQYDVHAAVPPAARELLADLWKRLLVHHDSIPPASRDFSGAVGQFRLWHPEAQDPIQPFQGSARLVGQSPIADEE